MAASCASKNSDGLQAYHRAVEYGAHRAKARHNDVAADNGGPWAAFSKLGASRKIWGIQKMELQERRSLFSLIMLRQEQARP